MICQQKNKTFLKNYVYLKKCIANKAFFKMLLKIEYS